MDLPKSSKERGHADFRQESQDDEPGSSSSTVEEVALVQPKTRCCSGRLRQLHCSFGFPEMCSRALVHLDIFHVIVLCETDLLFNKLYLQIYYRFVIQI